MIFRQLFDPTSFTYTYLLADEKTRQAILIDPVFEQANRDTALLNELKLNLVFILDTHCHADHVTSAWLLKQRTGARICVSNSAGVENADRYLRHGDQVSFGSRSVNVRETPGHTNGCLTYVLDDESMAFTGDCLLIRGCGRTDFQQGEARRMYESIHSQIFTLPDATLLYPAHDYRGLTVTSVGEEKNYNPRIGGKVSEADFGGYMLNLNLPHPRQIDIAVPANLKSGRPEGDRLPDQDNTWAPVNFTFAGIWEIDPQSLEERIQQIQVVDVRQADEYAGPMGHIAQARLIPLDELGNRLGEIEPDRPVVTVCRSGSRSAQACFILQKAGYKKVANLAGGMLRWRTEGHPVVGNID